MMNHTIIKIQSTTFRNVDRKYMGAITMREALYNSRNVPAVKIYEEVGPKKQVAFAAKPRIDLKNEYLRMHSAERDEFSTVEIAGAYSAFGNGGIYTKPHAIKKIVFRDGKTERNMAPDPVMVMKDSTAYMVTDMLRDVFRTMVQENEPPFKVSISLGKQVQRTIIRKRRWKSHMYPILVCGLYDRLYNCCLGWLSKIVPPMTTF